MSKLEHVPAGDWDVVRRNFEQLAGSIDTAGQSIGVRFGLGTLEYPGGSPSFTDDTTAHGLGRTPVAAFAVANHSNTFIGTKTLDATDLVVQGRTVDGSSPAAASLVNYYWLVIG